MTQIILFDAKLKCRSGKVIPYYEQSYTEGKHDGELVWFHECYGIFHLFRLEYVEDNTFIAVDMKRNVSNRSENFERWLENPTLAIREGTDIKASIRRV